MATDVPDHTVVMKKISAEEERELREIFNLVDEDRGGSISKEELRTLMETLGISATQEEIDKMVLEIDENSDGEIQVSVTHTHILTYTNI